MGLFRRGTSSAKRRDLVIQRLEEKAEEFWPQVPSTYPDGTEFSAREQYADVISVGKSIAHSDHPQKVDLLLFCMRSLAYFAVVADPKSHRVSFTMEAMAARQALLHAGMVNEERLLSGALLAALDYHERAGHAAIIDIDKDGNLTPVETDQADSP